MSVLELFLGLFIQMFLSTRVRYLSVQFLSPRVEALQALNKFMDLLIHFGTASSDLSELCVRLDSSIQ
ncbi:hypothetical protein AMK31_14310 [Streptomyces sp. TSRI0107]|nr:hypothetical protein AMK31_14310 [Streptomyces sp. TSRI0107]